MAGPICAALRVPLPKRVASTQMIGIVVCFVGSPRTEGHMPVTIGRRELVAALGGAAAWPLTARAAAGATGDSHVWRRNGARPNRGDAPNRMTAGGRRLHELAGGSAADRQSRRQSRAGDAVYARRAGRERDRRGARWSQSLFAAVAQGGALLGPSALAAHRAGSAGDNDPANAGRVQLARFFADNIAPSAPGLADIVVGGAASLKDAQRMLVE